VAVGQTLVTSFSVNNPALPSVGDFFIGLLLPDGSTIAFLTPGLAIGSTGNPAGFRPIAAGLSLASPFSASVPVFFSYTRNGSEPRGTYVFFFLFLPAAPPATRAIRPAPSL